MRVLSISLLLFFLLSSLSVQSSEWSIYTSLDSLTYSEPVTIKEFLGDFSGDYDRGEAAFTHNRFELGMTRGNWRVAWLERYDYDLEFTEDTALVTYLSENNLSLPLNRAYDLELDAEHSASSGLLIGYRFDLRENLSLDLNISMLKARDYISGKVALTGDPRTLNVDFGEELVALVETLDKQLSGTFLEQLQALQTIPDGEAVKSAFDAARLQAQQVQLRSYIDYSYSEPEFNEDKLFPEQDFSQSEGRGYASDLQVNWSPNSHWQMRLKVEDLFYRMKWKDTNTTRASLDVSRQLQNTVDDLEKAFNQSLNGNSFDVDALTALIESIEVNTDLLGQQAILEVKEDSVVQRLPWRADLDMVYHLNGTIGLLGGIYHTSLQSFPRMGIGINGNWRFSYDIETRGVGVGFLGDHFQFQLLTDSSCFEKAKLFGLNIGWQYTL